MKLVLKHFYLHRLAVIFGLAGLIVLGMTQACQGPKFSGEPGNNSSATPSNTAGIPLEENGEGYQGKISRFEYRDPENPCSSEPSLSEAPANDVIFVNTDSKPLLVRKDCQDQIPEQISNVSVEPDTGNLLFAGLTYVARTDDREDAETLNILCTTGTSVTGGNLISSPLDFTVAPWFINTGVSVQLSGSNMGFPMYNITRSISVPDWSRILGTVNLQAGQIYTFSALAEPGTNSIFKAMFAVNMTQNIVLNVDVDTTTGGHTVLDTGLTDLLDVVTEPSGAGYLVHVRFRLSANNTVDVGFGPGDATTDTSAIAGAARLHQCQ